MDTDDTALDLARHPATEAAPYKPRRPEATVLYQVVARHLHTFLRLSDQDGGRCLPGFVRRELLALLDCGILARGFLRVRCPRCREELLVAFSCKGRGICPSCGGRRMADTAAHLVDSVLPAVPVRQWVLSLPFSLRFVVAFDRGLCRAVRKVFMDTECAFSRPGAGRGVSPGAGCGASGLPRRAPVQRGRPVRRAPDRAREDPRPAASAWSAA